jgi:hypothetical protein
MPSVSLLKYFQGWWESLGQGPGTKKSSMTSQLDCSQRLFDGRSVSNVTQILKTVLLVPGPLVPLLQMIKDPEELLLSVGSMDIDHIRN